MVATRIWAVTIGLSLIGVGAHWAGASAVDPKVDAAGEASGKIINYMGAGLPVACFDNPNNRRFLGQAGAFAPQPTPRELAQAILELLQDPEERRRKGALARRRVEEEFSWEAGGRIYQEIFERALARRRGR